MCLASELVAVHSAGYLGLRHIIQQLDEYSPLQQTEGEDPEAAPYSTSTFSSFLEADRGGRPSNGVKSVQLASAKLPQR